MRHLCHILPALASYAAIFCAAMALADEPSAIEPREATADEARFFETHVRPVLATRCVKCHGHQKQESQLRLDSLAGMLAGGESEEPAIVPGKPDDSVLIAAINHESLEMPPDRKLPRAEIAALTEWIRIGAPWPKSVEAIRPAQLDDAVKITAEDRRWWSFQPVADSDVPQVEDDGWAKNDLDRFIFQRLAAEGLKPSPEAEPSQLLRRLYFDLVGLPPTPEEITAFEKRIAELVAKDPHPEGEGASQSAIRIPQSAIEEVVDRLLARPQYGEKWARHWLDLVRYAESDGYKADGFRPEAWRYRDYVIKSLNDDKPYDRFVMEQLAGDEIAPESTDALVATTYFRHGQYEYNQRDVRGQRDHLLEEITDVTGDTFLAMGMACARCHDHKFDPILQRDYYRLQAFFAPLLWREEKMVGTVEQLAEYQKKLTAWEEMTADVRRELDAIERPVLLKTASGETYEKFTPDLQAMIFKRPSERSPLEFQLADLASRQFTVDATKLPEKLSGQQKQRWEELKTKLGEYEQHKPQPLPTWTFCVSDVAREAPQTLIPGREPLGDIAPGYLSVIDSNPAEIPRLPEGIASTGRRTALARWIASPKNPLSTRVIVNRVWAQHFGRGIVATTSDFGRLGAKPTHPELLDWLTMRFVENGWKLKPLHRLIVLSATYRQTTSPEHLDELLHKDPQNLLVGRMNVRRLDAEQIRDALLAVSGDLDPKAGGPSDAPGGPRRTIYTKVLRNTQDPLLAAFDAPSGLSGSADRPTTTTATQALLLINGEWGLRRAHELSKRLRKFQAENDEKFVEQAWLLVYARTPTDEELAESLEFLKVDNDARAGVIVDFCHALLNSNEFLYVD
jgi:cytochrome c553